MNIELEGKPDYAPAMERLEAWFAGEIVDRAPVRFSRHNAFAEAAIEAGGGRWPDLRARWLDVEYQVERFLGGIVGRRFLAETFPVFWPNLGPDVYAAFHGGDLEFGEVTSWSQPMVNEPADLDRIHFDPANAWFRKIEELTRAALDKAPGRFLVGYTDLHPGLDCALAWRGGSALCMDTIENPEMVTRLVDLAEREFARIYDHFHSMIGSQGLPSVTWMEIPCEGRFHVPSCDFSAMISPEAFRHFGLPAILREVPLMSHNVFHLDGPGVAKNLDQVLQIPQIAAIQWVQGMGTDRPIMQWVPLIQRIRSARKSVVVDLELSELEPFMEALAPEGILLCLACGSEEEERAVLRRIEKWTR